MLSTSLCPGLRALVCARCQNAAATKQPAADAAACQPVARTSSTMEDHGRSWKRGYGSENVSFMLQMLHHCRLMFPQVLTKNRTKSRSFRQQDLHRLRNPYIWLLHPSDQTIFLSGLTSSSFEAQSTLLDLKQTRFIESL